MINLKRTVFINIHPLADLFVIDHFFLLFTVLPKWILQFYLKIGISLLQNLIGILRILTQNRLLIQALGLNIQFRYILFNRIFNRCCHFTFIQRCSLLTVTQ